jgi:transcriptional regulator NrdR family protein
MAKFVIKRDGSKEEFDYRKIKESLKRAVEDAQVPQKRKQELVDQILSIIVQKAGEKKVIKTQEIRDKILQELDLIQPAAAKAWKKFEQKK